MAYRKKTLRTMSPTARKVARLAGETESVATRLKNLIPTLQSLDLDSQALKVGNENHNFTIQDSDLWGIRDALYHGLDDGYLEENRAWAESMLERINQLREYSNPIEF
uniref:Uncharacterized protein n=1 Tax=viral metagenome TaxID=1070528 RepID=A0A6M3KWJ4_9ZZZZ